MLISRFDCLPNELYFCIFDYLGPIDLLFSFSNLTRRLTRLLRSYSRFTWNTIDLTRINPRAFNFYCSHPQFPNKVHSLKLNADQLSSISLSLYTDLRQLSLSLTHDFHHSQSFLLNRLEKWTVENYGYTWEKPIGMCERMKQVKIHLKSHSDLIELMNCLPVVQKLHATIDYDVSSSRSQCSSKLLLSHSHLTDFSYIIHQRYGLVYFVTDYSLIESLIRQLSSLRSLRLYVIGCLNTCVDGARLDNQLLNSLPKLTQFDFYLQSYGGIRYKSMSDFENRPWHFGSFSNDLTDMHFLFTVPFAFERIDGCVNEYFLNGIKTTSTSSRNNLEKSLATGMCHVKHVDLSCDITLNLITVLRDSFRSLESIRFSSSSARYSSPPSLARQSRYLIPSVTSLTFDHSCLHQSPFVRLLPRLHTLTICQSLLTQLLDETGSGYVCQVSELHVYAFQRHCLDEIIDGFPLVRVLTLNTLVTDDEGPLRSFLDHRCHHKHRPVSVTDVLELLFKSQLRRLKDVRVGCYFERDEEHLEAILSRIVRKYFGEKQQFHIQCEHFKSTRCGSVQFTLFN